MKYPLPLQNIFFALLLTLTFFAVTRCVYSLPFSYGDDHTALAMLHPDKASAAYDSAVLYGNTPSLKSFLIRDVHLGRFRPLSWCYEKVLCILCGDNLKLFRLSNLLILFLSVVFFFGIFDLLSIDKVSSIIVLLVYVFGRNNETWWVLIPPAQNMGELFLLAGIYFWLRNRTKNITAYYVLPALCFLLSALDKESFMFCIPVLLLTDYLFFNPSQKNYSKEYILSTLACSLPFLFLLATILYAKSIYAYPEPASALSILAYNSFQFAYSALFFIVPMFLLIVNRRGIKKSILLKLLLVFVFWTGIQLLLLKGIKLDCYNHLIPWLILPFAITAIALREIKKTSVKWYNVTIVAYCIAGTLFIKNTYVNSSAFSSNLVAYYKMIDTIKHNNSASEVVYLSIDACERDWIKGTRLIMDNAGIKHLLYFATIQKSVPAWEKDFAEHSPQNAFKHLSLDSAFCPDGKWIILVDTPAKNGKMDSVFSLYKRNDSTFIKMNGAERYVAGEYYCFENSYRDMSLKNIITGNFNAKIRTGFYGIKINK